MTRKSTLLRNLLFSNEIEFILEAHNGVSARIVEETGFKGVWSSGLSMSASFGLRDSNEASWTQVLDMLDFMSDAVDIPMLHDADTGYGNFNNVRRLVRKLEQREVAGMCIEDKLFPKTNSFINGETQPLAAVDEFCGKIKAAKDTQRDSDFCVVARVEAFVTGKGLTEALDRAHAYQQAGADAVLMHSKQKEPNEIFSFMEKWDRSCPIVVVPTTYHCVKTQSLADAGVSLVIWANHMIRVSITAMQEVAATILKEQSTSTVERGISPVSEIFRLQNVAELAAAEAIYLPRTNGA